MENSADWENLRVWSVKKQLCCTHMDRSAWMSMLGHRQSVMADIEVSLHPPLGNPLRMHGS